MVQNFQFVNSLSLSHCLVFSENCENFHTRLQSSIRVSNIKSQRFLPAHSEKFHFQEVDAVNRQLRNSKAAPPGTGYVLLLQFLQPLEAFLSFTPDLHIIVLSRAYLGVCQHSSLLAGHIWAGDGPPPALLDGQANILLQTLGRKKAPSVNAGRTVQYNVFNCPLLVKKKISTPAQKLQYCAKSSVFMSASPHVKSYVNITQGQIV